MKVLVTGATGAIGHEVCLALLRKGHSLKIVTRHSSTELLKRWQLPAEVITWKDPAQEPFPTGYLTDVEAVIHLSGESINQRWTDSAKARILASREQATKSLVTALNQEASSLKVYLGASAIGIYPNRGLDEITETSPVGEDKDFLVDVCKKWEGASEGLKNSVRRCIVRIGVVLQSGQGFLKQLEPLYQKGVAGPIGSGKRYLSWIHIDDLVGIFMLALESDAYSGVVNGTAPEPVNNSVFNDQFSQVMRVPNITPAPPIAIKLLYGEMSALALSNQNIIPERTLENGYKFNFEILEDALKNLYSWKQHYLDRRYYQWQWVPRSLEKTFDFFKTPQNLEKITPDFLSFKILDSSTAEVEKGSIINYKISMRGLPMKWQTEILEFVPNSHFIDYQNKGPYSKWHHTHRFENLAGGTYLTDEVVYRLPLGPLGALVASSFVQSDVSQIFNYRFDKLRQYAEQW